MKNVAYLTISKAAAEPSQKALHLSCMSGRAFLVKFGFGPKVDKISGLILA